MIKKIIKNIFSVFNLSVSQKRENRMSLNSSLKLISRYCSPDIIFDVGAAHGDFSKGVRKIFPMADFVLCEPVNAYKQNLENFSKDSKIHYIAKVIGDHQGLVEFFLHKDLVGSSIKKEVEGDMVDGKKINVEMITLDEVYKKFNHHKKILLKADVQGAELEVLRGAVEVLKFADVVVLEVSFFDVMIGGVDFYDIIIYMKEKGFVVYDIIGILYRPYDQAMIQADVVFVPIKSKLREFHGFATPEQRLKIWSK